MGESRLVEDSSHSLKQFPGSSNIGKSILLHWAWNGFASGRGLAGSEEPSDSGTVTCGNKYFTTRS